MNTEEKASLLPGNNECCINSGDYSVLFCFVLFYNNMIGKSFVLLGNGTHDHVQDFFLTFVQDHKGGGAEKFICDAEMEP